MKYSSAQIALANDEVPDKLPNHKQNCTGGLEEFDERFHLVMANTDVPLSNRRYRIVASSGEKFEGITDPLGYTERIRTKGIATLTLEILEES